MKIPTFSFFFREKTDLTLNKSNFIKFHQCTYRFLRNAWKIPKWYAKSAEVQDTIFKLPMYLFELINIQKSKYLNYYCK